MTRAPIPAKRADLDSQSSRACLSHSPLNLLWVRLLRLTVREKASKPADYNMDGV